MSAVTVAVNLVGNDLSAGSAVAGLLGMLGAIGSNAAALAAPLGMDANMLAGVGGAALAATAMFAGFSDVLERGVGAAAELQGGLVRVENALQADSAMLPTLTAAINDLAIKTVYSSADAAGAFEQLTEMGFSAQQTLYGMDAAASQYMDGTYHATEATKGLGNQALIMGQAMKTDATTAAQTLGSAVHIFAQEGMSAEQVANELAAAYLNGIPSATAIGEALNMAGANAATAHVKMQDFLITLDLLAQNGMTASSAGASLNYMLQSLIAPTAKQVGIMSELGIVTVNTGSSFKTFEGQLRASGAAGASAVAGFDGSVKSLQNLFYAAQNTGLISLDETFGQWAEGTGLLNSKLYDAQGQFIGMKGAIQVLDDAMQSKNTEQKMDILSNLFNIRSGRAARVLTNIQDFSDQYDAIATRFGNTDLGAMAARQLQTLGGAWDAFKDTITSALATTFLDFDASLAGIITNINGLIGGFLALPTSVKDTIAQVILVGTVLSGLVTLVAGGLVAFAALNVTLGLLGISLGAIATGAGIAVGVVAGGIVIFLGLKEAFEAVTTKGNALHDALVAITTGPDFSVLGQLKDVLFNGVGPALDTVRQDASDLATQLSDNLSTGSKTAADTMNAPNGLIAALQQIGVITAPSNPSGIPAGAKASSDAIRQLGDTSINTGKSAREMFDEMSGWQQVLFELGTFGWQAASLIVNIGLAIGEGLISGIINGVENLAPGLLLVVIGLGQTIEGVFQLAFASIFGDTFGHNFDSWTQDALKHIAMGGENLKTGVEGVLNGLYYLMAGWAADAGAGIALGFVNAVNGIMVSMGQDAPIPDWVKDQINKSKQEFDSLPGLVNYVITEFQKLGAGVWQALLDTGAHATQATGQMEQGVVNWIHQMVLNAINTLLGFPGQVQNIFTSMGNSAVSSVNSTAGRVTGAVSSLVSSVSSHLVSGLASIGANAGNGLINNLVGSISSGIGRVAGAVANIAAVAAGPLHHSVPDYGPLAHDDQWGAELVENFARSMTSRLGTLQQAANQVASTIQSHVLTPTMLGLTPGPVGVGNTVGTIVIPISLPGQPVATYVLNLATKQLRQVGQNRYAR